MLSTIFRVLIGFTLACIAAGLTQILFVKTPVELASGPVDSLGDRLVEAAIWGLLAATHAAVFAAAFALIAVGVAELLRIRTFVYYLLAGIGIALLGFYTQLMTESLGQPTVLNVYAMTAFACAGAVGGFVYWLTSGRWAGRRRQGQGSADGGKKKPRLIVEDATLDVTKANPPQKSLAKKLREAGASGDDVLDDMAPPDADGTSVRIEKTSTKSST